MQQGSTPPSHKNSCNLERKGYSETGMESRGLKMVEEGRKPVKYLEVMRINELMIKLSRDFFNLTSKGFRELSHIRCKERFWENH